ncbi:hypothetical protein J2W17_006219 [Pseudomonas lini]|uniref:hypothetical protein n=1 Tax=Pseudomonas lini TaxID=163011 RepID=UPI00278B0529|nr:hypothetical protein [Pseudomonas lini]MDQ0127221.1 hypothetical protein [Pseudomonas lini]
MHSAIFDDRYPGAAPPLIVKRYSKTGRVIRRDLSVGAAGERVPAQDQYLVPRSETQRPHVLRFVILFRAPEAKLLRNPNQKLRNTSLSYRYKKTP